MVRRIALLLGGVAAAVLGVAGMAWACTGFSAINLSATVGPAGSDLVVQGTGAAANAPVAMRWDSRTGPLAAQAVTDGAGAFSVALMVTPATPGVHVLVATDAADGVARGAFEVTSAGGARIPAQAERAVANDSARPLQVGMGLLGFGLVASASAVGIAVVGRRRTPVRAVAPGR